MKNKIFYLACMGFAAGVLLRSFVPVDFHAALFIGIISLLSVLIFSAITKTNLGILLSVFALAVSLGILRFHLADRPAPEIFGSRVGQKISLSGTIVERPVDKETGTEITVEVYEGGARTKILLFARKNDGYNYGDMINFSGKLERPAGFLTDQEKEFDYVNFLKKDGVFFVIRYPQIEVTGSGGGNFLKRALFSFSGKLAGALDAAIPDPESLAMRGMILGERASLSQSLRQALVSTGLIHIVTISGYHVTLVAEWIMKLLGFLPMHFAIGSGITAVFLYVIMTGGAQTAVRAGIMAALALLARVSGRIYDAGHALLVAAIIMIFANPFILAFDVSFELSFLATVAVIFIAPKVEKYLLWIRWRRLRDIVALTSAVYIFILPFTLYKIGNLSLVSLPANVAVLPLVPATMILGFVTGLAGIFSGILAVIPGKVAYVLLYCELAVIGFFSHMSIASLLIPNFPLALTVLVYLTFFYYLLAPSSPKTGEDQLELSVDDKRRGSSPSFRELNGGRGAVGAEMADSAKNPPLFRGSHRFVIPAAAFAFTLFVAGFLSFRHYQSNRIAKQNLQVLLVNTPVSAPPPPFDPNSRTKSNRCNLHGDLPDRQCTPGAVFQGATVGQICVPGYTQTVRNVSTELRKNVYAEYGISYPQPRGTYEVDHLIPLALAGSNDIANLWPEAAEPIPGFHEKDLVEVYLQEEVCSSRVALPAAQRQIATDWLAVYNNLSPEEILVLKKKYGGR